MSFIKQREFNTAKRSSEKSFVIFYSLMINNKYSKTKVIYEN